MLKSTLLLSPLGEPSIGGSRFRAWYTLEKIHDHLPIGILSLSLLVRTSDSYIRSWCFYCD